MSFLKKLFGNNESHKEKSDVAEKIIKIINCKCEVIPPTRDVNVLWNKYLEAYEFGKIKGFTPIFIIADENVLEMFEFNIEEQNEENNLLSSDSIDAKDFLQKRLDEYLKDMIGYGNLTTEEIYGKFEKGNKLDCFLSWRDYKFQKTKELIYAEIPTKNPWEIFKWLPIGGWNDCPTDKEIMSVSKLWYEEYGVVPALIGADTLEYYIENPVTDHDKAFKLAEQSSAFCSDIVSQGCGTIRNLAASIIDSNVLYFWWD